MFSLEKLLASFVSSPYISQNGVQKPRAGWDALYLIDYFNFIYWKAEMDKNQGEVQDLNQDGSLMGRLDALGLQVDPEQRQKIQKKIKSIRNYVPTVGMLGKTGAGKSSLCNAIFGNNVAQTSDVAACTREVQEIVVTAEQGSSRGLKLLDVPGLGESETLDVEYEKLYQDLIPSLDIILWVIKADDRALRVDKAFFTKYISPYSNSTPVIFVLNQVDKIEPSRDWLKSECMPSPKQLENIHLKAKMIAETFSIPIEDVCPVSASESFGLVGLISRIVDVLPNSKKYSIVREARIEIITREVVAKAEEGIWESIKGGFSKAFQFYKENEKTVDKAVGALFTVAMLTLKAKK